MYLKVGWLLFTPKRNHSHLFICHDWPLLFTVAEFVFFLFHCSNLERFVGELKKEKLFVGGRVSEQAQTEIQNILLWKKGKRIEEGIKGSKSQKKGICVVRGG